MLFGVRPIINTSGSVLVQVLYEESTQSTTKSHLSQSHSDFSQFPSFQTSLPHQNEMMSFEKIKVKIISQIPMGVPDPRISVFLAEAS